VSIILILYVPLVDDTEVPLEEHPNFISHIDATSPRFIWRPTDKTKSYYILYEKYDNVNIDPFRIYLLGRLGKFVDLEKPSLYDRWQIKLSLDTGIIPNVKALLQIGPFLVSLPNEITVSIRTNDPALRDYEGLNLKGLFPFLHEWGKTDSLSKVPGLISQSFKEGSEVMVKCLFTTYNIKGRSGYSFKLLEVFKVGSIDDDLGDGLVFRNTPLFPKKRKIEKGKAKEI
jgi:hypothetical protein